MKVIEKNHDARERVVILIERDVIAIMQDDDAGEREMGTLIGQMGRIELMPAGQAKRRGRFVCSVLYFNDES